MYTPKPFREDRLEVLHGFVREHPFATVINVGSDGPVASQAPLVLQTDAGPHGTLLGHLARANPQWKLMDDAKETLVLFHGPQTYVSPSLYPSKKEHGRVVPTWNYLSAQARGPARTFDDPKSLRAMLNHLTSQHEQDRPEPWAVDDAPADFLQGAMNAIVGFRLEIRTFEGQWKASQTAPSQTATASSKA